MKYILKIYVMIYLKYKKFFSKIFNFIQKK